MFRQFLQLNLETPHNKQLYSLKKNEFLLKQQSQTVPFNAICYSSEDIMSKITFEIITSLTKCQQPSLLTVTFNYNLEAKDLVLLVSKLLEIKIFQTVQLGHFEVKNGHISDYHAGTTQGYSLIDDLDQFDKDINTSVKLQRIWKINQFLQYRQLTKHNISSEMSRTNKKFGKRTNQFFVLHINNLIRIVLIILPRNRDLVFTKEEEKEIQELYIITKHAENVHEKNICFNTPIAQLMKNYLAKAKGNFFVSCYPQQDKSLEEVLKLPLRLSHPHEQEIENILEAYKKDKLTELEHELEKTKIKLKQTESNVKFQEENIKRHIKLYTKYFSHIIPVMQTLKQKGIHNIAEHIQWQKKQIQRKEEEVAAEEQQLKHIHEQMIMEEERHLFYLNKIKQYKQQVHISRQNTPKSTPNTSKNSSAHENKQNKQTTEELLLFFYNPQKELTKYRQKKEEESKYILNASKEKQQFMKLLEEAKKKLTKEEFNAFEQKYYHLIHE